MTFSLGSEQGIPLVDIRHDQSAKPAPVFSAIIRAMFSRIYAALLALLFCATFASATIVYHVTYVSGPSWF